MLDATKTANSALDDAKPHAYDWLRSCLFECVRLIAVSAERARQRRTLAGLDDHMLRDLGITRSQAQWECTRPFWR